MNNYSYNHIKSVFKSQQKWMTKRKKSNEKRGKKHGRKFYRMHRIA